MKDYNKILFDKINSWQGRYYWLDAFGRAGAEWVIIAALGWFVVSALYACLPNWLAGLMPLVIFSGAWLFAWCLNIGIGFFVREPRPHITEPQTHQLFTPLMSWKSFPSDHAMSAFLLAFVAIVLGLPAAGMILLFSIWIVFGRIYSGVHYPLDILGGFMSAATVAIWVKVIILLI